MSDLHIIRFISSVLFIGFFLLLCFLAGCSDSLQAEPVKSQKLVTIDPENTICYVFDLSASGWRAIGYNERTEVSIKINNGHGDFKGEPKTIECYSRDPNHPRILGDKVVALKQEWWQPRKWTNSQRYF